MVKIIFTCILFGAIPSWGQMLHDTVQHKTFDSLEKKIKLHITSDLPTAVRLCESGLTLAREKQNYYGEVLMLNLLEETHLRSGNYTQGIEVGLLSIQLNTDFVHDDILLANAYRTIGNIYNYGLKQYDEALEFYQIALTIYESRKESPMIATQYSSISWLYGITGKNMEEGLEMADKGIQIATELNNSQLLAYNYNSKGVLFTKMGLYDSALIVLLNSIEYGMQVNDKAVIAYNKSLVGEAYFQKGKYDAAIQYFKEAAEEASELNVREVAKDAYLGMAHYYEVVGDTDQALRFYQRYTALKDSLLNREIAEQALFYENRIEREHQQSVIAELELDNQQAEKEKQVIILLMVTGGLLFTVVMFFVTKINRQRKAANRLLQEKNDAIIKHNEELERLNGTKDKLFSIIGHDMRSPIGNLNSILELMRKNMMNAEEMQTLLPKLNQTVGGLHEMLESLLEWSHSQMKGFQLAPERIDLKEIADKTLSFYLAAAQQKNIMLSSKLKESVYAYADKNHVLLALRNLVSNAIKFTEEEGSVKITAIEKESSVVLEVKDTGIGIDEAHLKQLFQFQKAISKRGTHGEKGTGFGLALCKEMVAANQGTIAVETEVNTGTTFSITLLKKEWKPEVITTHSHDK